MAQINNSNIFMPFKKKNILKNPNRSILTDIK